MAEPHPGDYSEILAAELVEVGRQEGRADAKAVQLAGLAGTLSTLSVAAATGLSSLAPRVSGWLLLGVVALLVAGGLWAAAVGVLLRRVIRPRLAGAVPGSFARPGRISELRALSLIEYRESAVQRLGGLVLARYRAVQRASDLLTAGFIPPLAMAVVLALTR